MSASMLRSCLSIAAKKLSVKLSVVMDDREIDEFLEAHEGFGGDPRDLAAMAAAELTRQRFTKADDVICLGVVLYLDRMADDPPTMDRGFQRLKDLKQAVEAGVTQRTARDAIGAWYP